MWGVVSGCVGSAIRLCMWESSGTAGGWMIGFLLCVSPDPLFHAAALPFHSDASTAMQ